MKRQSKAEEALTRQLEGIRRDIAREASAILNHQTRRETFVGLRDRIEDEISRLQTQRLKASESRK